MISLKLGVVAYGRQPAMLESHVVADLDRPDIEAKPDVLRSFLAGYAIPPVSSLLQAAGDDTRRRASQRPLPGRP